MKKFMAVFAMAAIVAFSAPSFAATNPFMDVPQGHWAYDAVALLASRGMVVGYPDGAFKGAQPATRYELAAVVARAVAAVDAEKASAQDMELLKKLVMEFKDELDALGVKVDELDKRVAVVEEAVGGWKLSGQFFFDANFAGGDQTKSNYTESAAGDNSFEKARFWLALQKQIDEKTSFYAQFRSGSESSGTGVSGLGDITQINVRNIYLDTVIPWGIDFRVGRFFINFEDDHKLYYDNDAIFGDYRVDGFQFAKTWQNFAVKAVVGRNIGNEWETNQILRAISGTTYGPNNAFSVSEGFWNYALDLTWQPTENFLFGISGNWMMEDSSLADATTGTINTYVQQGGDISTYSAYLAYNFTPAIRFTGIYYYQDLGQGVLDAGMNVGAFSKAQQYHTGDSATETNPTAWRVALDLGQDLLKVTGLHFEYMQHSNTFLGVRKPYSFDVYSGNAANMTDNMPWNDGTTKMYFFIANQKWNDKWSSYIRYSFADFDTTFIDDAQSYGIGVTYQYTPAIAFRLAYDLVDYGVNDTTTYSLYTGKDHVFQFRTTVNF